MSVPVNSGPNQGHTIKPETPEHGKTGGTPEHWRNNGILAEQLEYHGILEHVKSS